MTALALIFSNAEKKSSDLALINNQVKSAQYNVAQQQAIVNSLLAKSSQFVAFLAQATDNQASALSNYNLAKNATANVASLADNFTQAQTQTTTACDGVCEVSKNMADLIVKLIFSVEIIDKVTQLINKQKAMNPLVPDSLIAFMAKAGTDADNAMALTLTALQSCYAAQSTLQESKGIVDLGYHQAQRLQHQMNDGWDVRMDSPDSKIVLTGTSIMSLLQRAYQVSIKNYNQALWDNNSVTQQLTYAQTQLAAATMNLNSYQSGQAAATAAAYAA